MKTLFQISTQCLSAGSNLDGADSLPVQKNISVSGPHGPVAPGGPHQLSSLPRYAIRSAGTPNDFQISADSSSRGASLSPSNTVNANFSSGMPSQFLLVKNSNDQAMDSCFQ